MEFQYIFVKYFFIFLFFSFSINLSGYQICFLGFGFVVGMITQLFCHFGQIIFTQFPALNLTPEPHFFRRKMGLASNDLGWNIQTIELFLVKNYES